MAPAPGNVKKLFPRVKDYFSPKVVGEVNDSYVKIVRAKGRDIPWHTHAGEDELFLVFKGRLTMELENESPFDLRRGEFFIVPRGTRHRPYCDRECWIMLFESKTTRHTGDVQTGITKSIEEQLA
jgi:quercetin dioxygenase-like cupin family protein